MQNQEILNLIVDLLEKAGMGKAIISIETENSTGAENSVWFSVELENPSLFLGHNGEALSALNHLVKKIIENKTKADVEKIPEILIDIGEFQKKKIENVKTVAHMMAERARYFRSNIEIDPMPAFERRIIHEFLSTATDLKTESEGIGSKRRVVIKYIGTN